MQAIIQQGAVDHLLQMRAPSKLVAEISSDLSALNKEYHWTTPLSATYSPSPFFHFNVEHLSPAPAV